MKRLQKVKWQLDVERYIDIYNGSLAEDNIKRCIGAFFNYLTSSTNLSANTIRIRYACLSVFERWIYDVYVKLKTVLSYVS